MDTRTPIERLIDQACGYVPPQDSTAQPPRRTETKETAHLAYVSVQIQRPPVPPVWVVFPKEDDETTLGFVKWDAELRSWCYLPEAREVPLLVAYLEDIAHMCRALPPAEEG